MALLQSVETPPTSVPRPLQLEPWSQQSGNSVGLRDASAIHEVVGFFDQLSALLPAQELTRPPAYQTCTREASAAPVASFLASIGSNRTRLVVFLDSRFSVTSLLSEK